MMKRPNGVARVFGWDKTPISRAEHRQDLHDKTGEVSRRLRCKIYAELVWRRENNK